MFFLQNFYARNPIGNLKVLVGRNHSFQRPPHGKKGMEDSNPLKFLHFPSIPKGA
jgi:hypothetical protein